MMVGVGVNVGVRTRVDVGGGKYGCDGRCGCKRA